jgi:fused signal recognition particle receptor
MKAAGSPRDDVPLTDDAGEPSDRPEPKRALRQRFRQGLRKTRQKFTRDMREVFATGATDVSFDTLEEALVAADVGVLTATALTDAMRVRRAELTSDHVQGALKQAMVARLSDADRRLRLSRDKTSIWVVCGVNGTGKTTSIAKLAARAKSLGIRVCMAAADTFRAAAVEQLEEWGRRIEVAVIRQDAGADPGAVVFDAIAHAQAQGLNLVIVDTAGRLHTRKPLMDELQKVLRVIDRSDDAVLTECLLVIDATTGQNGIAQAQAFRQAAGVTGLVLAKLDGTAKGGVVFAVEQELGVPVKAVGTGEHFRDLVPFEPDAFVDAMIGED